MAEVPESGGGKSKGKVRAKKQSTKIDMTPMVDLAFLLLTFFILTTTLAEQKTLDLVMPTDDTTGVKPSKVNNAITVILSKKDKVYYYEDELKTETVLNETTFKDLRKIISEKNRTVVAKVKKYYEETKGKNIPDSTEKKELKKLQDDPKGAFVIIKYDSLAPYRSAIDIVDEMEICAVPSGKYAIVKKLEPAEKAMLRFKYAKN